MKQVQKPKKPLIFYYLIALAVLFHAIGGLLERRAPVRTRGSAAA